MQNDDGSQTSLTPAQRELEDALRGLAPAASGIDRDRLLFEAGTVAGRGRTRSVRWVVGGLAAGLALALLLRPEPRVVERVVIQPPATAPAVSVAGADRKTDAPPASRPDALAGATHLPLPVPGGPFVTMPPGYVSVASFQPTGDTRTSAYLGALQDVLQRGLKAIPGTRNWRRDRDGNPAGDAAPPQDAMPAPATDESHGS